MVDFNVNGKIAVVTGGTRGLGLYCAEALLLNGASTVVITSRKAKLVKKLKSIWKNLPKTTTRIVKLFHILQILLLKKNVKNSTPK